MKKTLIINITFALLFTVVAMLLPSRLATANLAHHDPILPDIPYGPASPFPDPPDLIVQSPQYNKTYYVNEILLNFTVINPYTQSESTRITEVSYTLDGLVNTLWNLTDYPLSPTQQFSILLNASTGQHILQLNVHAEITFYSDPRYIYSASTLPVEVNETILFTINTRAFPQPSVSITSPENKTYVTTNIPLKFAVNESRSQISYSLDGQNNVTIAGNTTLTSLSKGEHNLTVYAINVAGNIEGSETVIFTIANNSEPFPVAIAAVLLASVAVVAPSLAVYFKKRKH